MTANVPGSARFLLMAPWPLAELAVALRGARLWIQAEGLEGLDTSAFVLNIEGSRTDWKLDASQVRWGKVPGTAPGSCTYTTSVEAREPAPSAVNLYVSGAPALSLRAAVERVQVSPPGLPAVAYVAAQAASADTAAGLHVSSLRVGAFRLLQSVDLRIEPAFAVIAWGALGHPVPREHE